MSVTPLEILLTEMRRHWGSGEREAAVALARIAAPYMHGRAMVTRPFGDLAEVPDEELGSWAGDGGAAASGVDPG